MCNDKNVSYKNKQSIKGAQVCKDFIVIFVLFVCISLHVCFSTVSRHGYFVASCPFDHFFPRQTGSREQNQMCDISLRDLRKQTRLFERFRQEIIVQSSKQRFLRCELLRAKLTRRLETR